MAGKRISIFACASQPVLVEGLRSALNPYQEFEFVGAASGAEALEALAGREPDVVLLDDEDGAAAAIAVLSRLRNTAGHARAVVWIGRMEQADRIRALELGARGIIRKDQPIDTLLECLRSAAAGRLWIDETLSDPAPPLQPHKPPRLTPRERQIVGLIAQGMKNSQIAEALSISPGTVKVHLMHVFEKTGASDRFDLAMRSRKLLGASAP